MNFSERLKAIRLENEMTQKNLYEKLSVSPNCYASWEQGRTQPDIERIKQLVSIFNVSADYLLGIKDEANEPLVLISSKSALPKEEKKLLNDYRSLTENEKKEIRDFLDFLKSKQ